MLDIDKTKNEIVDARVMYEQNVREVALLEELKVKSEAAEQQLEACKNILPDSLGDVFLLEEDVLGKCKSFGLSVTSIDQTVAVNETQEVVFTIVANGSYRNIYNFMNYYSNLEQVHRFDSISLSRNADGTYSVTLALAFLSEQGAEGAVSAVVDGAIQDAAS
jgi:Tfp pilus assembly protein PilO